MEDDYQAVTSMHACPLKLSRKDFERLGDRAIRLAAEHIAGIRERPVHRRVPVHKKRLLMDGELPHAGLTADEIISFIDQNMLPYPLPNGHPMSFAWFLPPPAPIAVLAETLATTINASGDGFEHAGTYLLPSVTRWLMQLCGFPVEASMGLLLSGGSMANLTALTAARHRAARDAGWN
ncbi:MAG: amino acid decarboxylase, partial [Woeseiaceae bacterium]